MDLVAQNRKAYNDIAPHFSATRARLWPEFNEFTSYLRSGQRILDWGCGNGRLLTMLTDKEISYVGVDQSSELLKQAEQTKASLGIKNDAEFLNSENGEPQFAPGSFDLVFMIASFFHLPNVESRLKLLTKTYQDLKSGGRLCMLLWNLESDWANLKKPGWTTLGPGDYLIPWKDKTGQVLAMRYYHHFTEQEITDLLTKTGFKIERLDFSKGTWADDKGGRNMIVVAQKP